MDVDDFFEGLGHDLRTTNLVMVALGIQIQDFFIRFFITNVIPTEPRIKHKNPRGRLERSECFLVTFLIINIIISSSSSSSSRKTF